MSGEQGDFSFPREIRIKSRKEFETVRRKGVYYKSSDGDIGMAIVEGKGNGISKFGINTLKGFKSAVERNRAKRIIREYIRHNKTTFPKGSLVLLFASPKTAQLTNNEIRKQLHNIFVNYKLNANKENPKINN